LIIGGENVAYKAQQQVRQLIKSIVDYMRGRSGNNFQNDVYIVLREYYKAQNKTFEMPQAMGGDGKNDGWVVEDNIYYMVYAPSLIRSGESFLTAIINKFKSDLSGLLDNVYRKGMWGQTITKVIFLVNTHDLRLPADTNRVYEQVYNENKKNFQIDFQYEVTNLDLIQDMLEELSLEIVSKINSRLNMAEGIDLNEPNMSELMETIGLIAKESGRQHTSGNMRNYKRISTQEKINLNNLTTAEKKINQLVSQLGIVDAVIEEMSVDINEIAKFETTKNYIINIYEDYKSKYNGVELYTFIVEYFANLFPNSDMVIYSIEYLVVYIFDKCDIFEKEAV